MRIARLGGLCAAVVFACLASNCSSIIDSYRVAGVDATEPEAQAAGSYFLPKHLVHVEVSDGVLSVSSIAVQDTRSELQSGFNLSAFADDNISITYENGLLKKVAAVATDRTADVIIALAKDVAALRAAKTSAPAIVATFDFDPFNYTNALQVNSELKRQFNGCVEVELKPGLWSPGCTKLSLNERGVKAEELSDLLLPLPPVAPGIYYRRPIAHRVHVVEKGRTKEITAKLFANIAPTFRIDVNRTLFVKRQTTIDFADGVPTGVTVVKDSEALAVAKLPLDVANAVVSSQVDAIVQRKSLVDAQTNLTKSETDNLNAKTELIKAGAAAQSAGVDASSVDGRSSIIETARAASVAGVGAPSRLQCLNAGIADMVLCAQLFRSLGQ